MKHFSAVKIARLAVRKGLENQNLGLGRAIVVFIQVFFLLKNKTGCRFLTVDSYPGAIGFYKKVGFKKIEKNPDDVKANDHVLMYLDLAQIKNSAHVQEIGAIVDTLIQSNKAEFTMLG
jgi:predicted N-acetyltransferase YhbS